jgi:membrane associated rhomboid family serine protease
MGKKSKRSLADALEISASIVLVLFAMFYVNRFLGGRLNYFGIIPRTGWGLIGIIFSPLLHYNEVHLIANSTSLFLLLVILFLHREYQPVLTFTTIWLASGLGTWMIGRPSIHIGASSIIYGLVTYLIAAAWWLRTWNSALWAILILFCYGGIFYGALPQPGFISWEGHLSGAIAGVLVARYQHK